MAKVELKGVAKSFGAVRVLDPIDLCVEPGEFVAFVGPSGSGKSTLLRMIAGLESVSEGDVLIGGEEVTFAEPSERGTAMVFQSYALYPHMNVYDNIAFNLRLAKRPKSEIDAQVREAARTLRLEDLLERSPAQLSGGQRQRVAIGRAIVRHPKVFLFDEPLSNLDAALRVQMRLEIARLHREIGATMIYVTHDQVEAMTLADRIVALDDGAIQQTGAPLDLYARPSNRFVAGFIGSPKMNFIPAEVIDGTRAGVGLRLHAGDGTSFGLGALKSAKAGPVSVGVRPEAIRLHIAGGTPPAGTLEIPARVDSVERLGNVTYTYIDVGSDELLTVQSGGDVQLKSGDQALAAIQPESFHVFDAAGKTILSASAAPART